MNKKKFLATCTLVAFGSTMLPAFALAANGDYGDGEVVIRATATAPAQEVGTVEWNNKLKDVTLLKIGDLSFSLTTKDNGATIGGASDPLTITYVTTGSNKDSGADDKFKVTVNETAAIGDVYRLHASQIPTINDASPADVDFIIRVTGTPTVTEIEAQTDADAGKIKLTDTSGAISISTQKIGLLTGENGVFADGTELGTIASNLVSADKLKAGNWYGLDASSITEAAYPSLAQFQYTDEMAQAVKDALAEKVGPLEEKLALISADAIVNVGTSGVKLVDGLARYVVKDGASVLSPDKVATSYIDPVLAQYMKADGTINYNLLPAEPVKGAVTIAVTNGGASLTTAPKDITVTFQKATEVTLEAVKEAYIEKYLAEGNTLSIADGEVVSLPTDYVTVLGTTGESTPVTVTIKNVKGTTAFVNAVDTATGVVTNAGAENLTGTFDIVLANDNDPDQTIAGVKVTITPASEEPEQPDSIEEAKEVFGEKFTACNTIMTKLLATDKITAADFLELNKAYSEMLQSYNAYKALKDAAAN